MTTIDTIASSFPRTLNLSQQPGSLGPGSDTTTGGGVGTGMGVKMSVCSTPAISLTSIKFASYRSTNK